MSILDVIAKETGGIRQYSDQYQIRSNGSHTVHTVQECPFTPEECHRLPDHDNYMLDALFSYADLHSNRTIDDIFQREEFSICADYVVEGLHDISEYELENEPEECLDRADFPDE